MAYMRLQVHIRWMFPTINRKLCCRLNEEYKC